MLRKLTLASLAFALSAGAIAAYIPKAAIKIERTGLTSFKITGKNGWGDVDVKVEDKHLFQGFRSEGKAGDKVVQVDVKSAGLGDGWKMEGKIGDLEVQGTCKQDGLLSKSWTVKAKVGDRMIEGKADSEWDIDPAAQAVFILFDYTGSEKKDSDSAADEGKKGDKK